MTDNPLWDRIQQYMDDPSHRYSPKPADLARETGISEQVLSKWKAKPVLPEPLLLLAFAMGTGVPYAELLTEALRGKGYVPPGAVVQTRPGFDRDMHDRFQILADEATGAPMGIVRKGTPGEQARDDLERINDLMSGSFISSLMFRVLKMREPELANRLEATKGRLEAELSALTDTPELAVAAHEEDESIAGEAEKLSGQ